MRAVLPQGTGLHCKPCAQTRLQIADSLLQHDGEPWQHGWLPAQSPLEPWLSGVFCCAASDALPPASSQPPAPRRTPLAPTALEPPTTLEAAQPARRSDASVLDDEPYATPVQSGGLQAGCPIAVVGSPFGCLQPDLLCNSVRYGHVANCFSLCGRAEHARDLASAPAALHSAAADASDLRPSHVLTSRQRDGQPGKDLLLLDMKALPGVPSWVCLDTCYLLR